MPNEIEVLLTIFGVALCLGGWVIFQLGTKLLGLAVGLGFGFGFGFLLAMALQLDGNMAALVQAACALLGAFGGLLLIRAVTTFAFGATGFLFGAMLGRLGSELWMQSKEMEFAFNQEAVVTILTSAAVVGLLAVWMKRLIIIVATSFMGATFLGAGVVWLQQHRPSSVLAVFFAAILWQLVLAGRLLSSGSRSPARAEQ